jgi:hypothetical protein
MLVLFRLRATVCEFSWGHQKPAVANVECLPRLLLLLVLRID